MLKGLILSDLHSGSIYSVAVQKARTDTIGGTIGLNSLQSKILLPKWKEMCSAEPYDFVVVLGDLVDGLNQKSKGMGLWTNVLDLQAENAAKLLNMIPVKPEAPIDIIGGTPYHRGENPGIDQSVAEKLAGMNKNSRYRGLEYLLEIEKQRFHFCHWAPNALYDGTSLAKEVLLSKKHDVELIGMFRGHRHHYGFYSNGFRFACMLPAWKGRDEYVQTFGMKYATTQIGFVELEVAKEYWNVKPTLWNLKDQMKVSKIAGQKETFQE